MPKPPSRTGFGTQTAEIEPERTADSEGTRAYFCAGPGGLACVRTRAGDRR